MIQRTLNTKRFYSDFNCIVLADFAAAKTSDTFLISKYDMVISVRMHGNCILGAYFYALPAPGTFIMDENRPPLKLPKKPDPVF